MSYKKPTDRDYSPSERAAQKAFRDKRKPMTEYEMAQQALHKNRERLKAERLAREAAKSQEIGHQPAPAQIVGPPLVPARRPERQ
jgi:hypothetical protein